MTVATENILLTAGSVDVQARGSENPRVTIVAYSGGLMSPPGWGPLVIDLAGLDASAKQIGILADHDSTLNGIVGHGEADVVDGKLLVAGTIVPDSDVARRIVALVRSGFRFQASVGVSPSDYVRVRAGETVEANGQSVTAPDTGMLLVRASTLREVSIVAIGADAQTSVAIAASGERTAEEIRAEAHAETERIVGIREACDGKYGEIEAKAIAEGWDVRRTKLQVLRESRPKISGIGRGHYTPNATVLEAAVLAHMGRDELAARELGEHAAQRARDMRCSSLLDLCRCSLEAEGRGVPHGRTELIRAALSTYSLPVALGDAANKVLFETYRESPATWRVFADVKSAGDFKEHTGIRPSETGDLSEVPKGGELKHGSVDESTYKYAVDTFGKALSIDRRDIVNDDLSLFDDTARSLGRSAMRSLSDLVYKVLLANAGGFFGAGNGNYDDGAGTALSSASLGAGLAKMMAQRDDEDRDLDIRARTLLVAPELQQTAKELLESDFIQRASDDRPTGNALKHAVSLEVEPRLSNDKRFSGTSTTAWYLFGSPADTALIVAFLQGKRSPTVEFFGFDADPNTLAATWRVFFDYGCSLGDFRAAYKAAGA